jgi:hypothetical protein
MNGRWLCCSCRADSVKESFGRRREVMSSDREKWLMDGGKSGLIE